MAYTKVMWYADIAEVTTYEKHPLARTGTRAKRQNEVDINQSQLVLSGIPFQTSVQQTKVRKERNESDVRRAVLAFRRLCVTNLARFGNPVWASFTYGSNQCDVGIARKDWQLFTERARKVFGKEFRYIAVTEFQQRGAVHFHAFLWGIEESLVATERSTRLVAGLWGKGFCDSLVTDGSAKMATYMSKYAGKNFADPRLNGRRVYFTSRNIARPIVDRGAVLGMYFHGDLPDIPDLSTGVVLHESEYDTHFMGRANYKKYKLLKAYAQSNAQELRCPPSGISPVQG